MAPSVYEEASLCLSCAAFLTAMQPLKYSTVVLLPVSENKGCLSPEEWLILFLTSIGKLTSMHAYPQIHARALKNTCTQKHTYKKIVRDITEPNGSTLCDVYFLVVLRELCSVL